MDEGLSRVRLLLASFVAFLLPTLALAGDAGSTAVAGTLLAVALAAVLTVAGEHAWLGSRLAADPVGLARTRTPIVLAGVTDAAHHPQRPRAPGPV